MVGVTKKTISNADTLEVTGGTGITTTGTATDTISLAFTSTELNDLTWGDNSDNASIAWTFNQSGATDPTLTITNDLITVSSGLTVTGTTTTNGTLTANGVVTLGDNGDTVAVNSSDWDINTTGDMTGIGSITADGAISFTPSFTNDITFNVDTDSLLTLDSSVTNADNFVISPNNAGTGATFTGTLTSNNLTADRTWTLKDADGTIAFTSDIPVSDNYQNWVMAGDSGTPQTISSTATANIVGGTNGIDTVASATNNLTINLDTTEIGTTTFGSGSAITWTFDASAGTDTTIAFGDNSQTFTAATLTASGDISVNGGNVTLGTNGQDGTLTVYSEQGGTDFTTVFQPGTQTQNITYTLPVDDGTNNYVLTTDGNGLLAWTSVSGVGGMNSFTLSGDGGSDQTISDADTLEVTGGTGITTTGTATDTISLAFTSTELNDLTWEDIPMHQLPAFNQSGATDPTPTITNDLITVSSGLTVTGQPPLTELYRKRCCYSW